MIKTITPIGLSNPIDLLIVAVPCCIRPSLILLGNTPRLLFAFDRTLDCALTASRLFLSHSFATRFHFLLLFFANGENR